MPKSRVGLFFVCLLLIIAAVGVVSAHANLQRAEPGPNAVLQISPPEIRLWFTEPLEPQFSRIILRDSDGNVLNTPASFVDPVDAFQMALQPGELPDGLYTVAWRALSAADGHPSMGSYPFVIGDASLLTGAAATGDDTIPVDGTAVRWLNLLSMAFGVGSLGFLLFVWSPAAPQGNLTIENTIRQLIWLGWLLIGFSGALMLLLQYSLATGNPLLIGINGDSLNALVAESRFGHLWLTRMAMWVGLGGALWFARSDYFFYGVALVFGGIIMVTNSVYSHANAAFDLTASVAADFLHLIGMVLWVGGLIAFIRVLSPIRRQFTPAAPLLANLVARFSNFARVAVAILIITGLYSTWLQVGSLDAFLNTNYGRALLVKIILVLPVLLIAFVNLVYTHRALESGQENWVQRFRGLLGIEIVLTLAMLITVGMMTSIQPARSVMAERAANPPPPEPQPIINVISANDLVVELSISPGWIGENTFTLKLVDTSGNPINDASLIRMRFESQVQNLGESELRPTLSAEGVYTITGANLSVPGEWRIRTTIQRPDVFDTLIDFRPTMDVRPSGPTPVPLLPPNSPLPNRVIILLVAGIISLAIGGFFLGENRARLLQASALLAIGLLIVGGLFLMSAVQGVSSASESAAPPAVTESP